MSGLKRKLEEGGLAIGTWMQIPSGDIAEMVAREGYDFCAADLEHTEISNRDLAEIFRGLRGSDCDCAVRVASNEQMNIRRPLDLGAELLIVPLVNSAAEAERAVRFAKYPPRGVRGYAFCRSNCWSRDFDEYVRRANEDVLLLVMVESREAVENIDDILAVDGVDGVFIGPYDLSGSYGVIGEVDHPLVLDALSRVVRACKRAGKIPGQHIVTPTPERVRLALRQGYRFLALGIDALFILNELRKNTSMLKAELKGR